ncbi:MAG: LemA family protein [Deltaproteobacteria bacterium]|nr:LemA family protein [Deltaproteobacteria bacterium]
MKKLTWLIPVGALVVAIFWIMGQYNGFVHKKQTVEQSWAQVENVLQRRSDLIPNLMNVVQSYAVHEQSVFIQVAQARSLWNKTAANPQATIEEKMTVDRQLSGALFNLMAVVERYPDLKANQNFMALQDELAGTENRIAVERMRFNESVQGYNVFAQTFPRNWLAGVFSFPAERVYFKAVEGAAAAPKVEMQFNR